MCMYVLLPQTFPVTGASTPGSLGIAAEDGVSHEVLPALLCFVASACFLGEKTKNGEEQKRALWV